VNDEGRFEFVLKIGGKTSLARFVCVKTPSLEYSEGTGAKNPISARGRAKRLKSPISATRVTPATKTMPW
jgi:hypothetical protein